MRRSLLASVARLARYTTKADATRLEAARSASLADRSSLAAELSGRWIVTTGDPQQTESAGDSFGFALRVDEVNLGVLRAALFPAPPKQRRDEGHLRTALIFGASCHPGLPLSLAARPLVEAARAELAQRGAERVMGLAPLTGLCGWVVEEQAWERLSSLGAFGDEAAGAVEAVARGVPRPGHSVLGQGTFSAAQKAFEALATAYARRDDPESECLAYLEAGADLAAVHWLHDTSQEAVRDRAGVSASLEFGAYSPAAEATADELYMPSSGIYTPPGGEAS